MGRLVRPELPGGTRHGAIELFFEDPLDISWASAIALVPSSESSSHALDSDQRPREAVLTHTRCVCPRLKRFTTRPLCVHAPKEGSNVMRAESAPPAGEDGSVVVAAPSPPARPALESAALSSDAAGDCLPCRSSTNEAC